MNISAPPTNAERLAKVPTGALPVRLEIARGRGLYSQTPELRAKCLDEIDAIRNEMKRRGLAVTL